MNTQRSNGQSQQNNSNASRPASQPGQPRRHGQQPSNHGLRRQVGTHNAQSHRVEHFGHRRDVYLPVGKGAETGYAVDRGSILAVLHFQGDITILEVVTPVGVKPQAAAGVHVTTNYKLSPGDSFRAYNIQVERCNDTILRVKYQARGRSDAGGTVLEFGSCVEHHYRYTFPDIRGLSQVARAKLEEFTHLTFQPNNQIRWRQYSEITTGAEFQAFQDRDAAAMRQSQEQFAEVEWASWAPQGRRNVNNLINEYRTRTGVKVDTQLPQSLAAELAETHPPAVDMAVISKAAAAEELGVTEESVVAAGSMSFAEEVAHV